MRRTRFIFGAFLAVLGVMPLRAQEPAGTIRGSVTDSATQQALVGVTVTFGTRSGLTGADGRFMIDNAPVGQGTLRARMLGYTPASRLITVAAGQTVTADLTMTAQAVNLSEIVVTGYGEQRAGDITGAVTALAPEEFNTGRIVSPAQLIQTKVAGVQVVDNNEPGGGLAIRIRGATSVNASSDPLYVIDGMPVGAGSGGGLSAGRDPLNFLNPEDIENITVLRDASAAAIYGANAANGVIIITTKRPARAGRQGTQIEYTTSFSASTVTRLPSMLSASQFRTAVTTYAPQNVNQLGTANTNWFDLVDRTGFGQEHNLSVTGANESMSYRLSLGYLNEDGVIQGTNLERVTMGLNYAQRMFGDRLDVRANIKGSRAADQFTPGGVLSNAAQMGPTQPVRDAASTTGFYNWPGNTLQSPDNPVEILNNATDNGTTYRSMGNMQLQWHMPWLEGLNANVNVGYDIAKASRETFNPSTLHAQLKAGTGGTDYRNDNTQLNTVLETYLNYAAPLRVMPGNIDVTAGYSYAQSHGEYPSVLLQGLSTNLLSTNGIPTARTVQNFLNIQDSKLISFFGRVNYNLADRYLVAFSLRRDGSSRFGSSHAWGVFPSVSGAWRMSGEPFMQGFASTLSDLKLRASYGVTGNQAFDNYQQYATYQYGDNAAQVQLGSQFITTIRPAAVDPGIKWEETRSYDVGIDYGFLNQRFYGAIDWYSKRTSDLIFTVPVAGFTNFRNTLTTNIGKSKNTGIELSLNARMLEGQGNHLAWTANFTASHNTNELVSINPYGGAVQQIMTGFVSGGVGTTIQVREPGEAIDAFFVCRQYYQNGKPVQGQYLSLVGDTVKTGCANNERRAFHDPAPHWMLGHTSYLTYGNLDFSFTLRAYLGNWVYNNVASNLGTYSEVTRASPYNLHSSVLTTNFTQPQYLSDYYVEDASFLRMDNITLGYTFRYHGNPLRVFATVQNAFTLTGYSGVDPTAGINGIDNNIYPRSRKFTGGLNVRF